MNMNEVKAIVFDLDGTLYEDTHHFKYYAEIISKRISQKSRDSFMREYEAAAAGKHTLKIGRLYDKEKDYVLVHKAGMVTEGYTWDGNPLSKALVGELYPHAVEIDMQKMFSIGDLWWIPGAIGIHYGLERTTISSCFLEVREFMMGKDFTMHPVQGFKEALQELHSKIKLVLLTNSPQPDSEIILQKLGLDTVFHRKIFQAKKPTMTSERFRAIREEFNINYENILSIGDNYINDILPVKKLGCKTIYIDIFKIGDKEDADEIVNSITDMMNVLKDINN